MRRRIARILTALALVVGLGAGISAGPAEAAPPTSHGNITADVDWWW